MGKRTREKTDDEIKNKIKRLEKELQSRKQFSPEVGTGENKDLEIESYYESGGTDFDARNANGEVSEEEDWRHSPPVTDSLSLAKSDNEMSPKASKSLASLVVDVASGSTQNMESLVPTEVLAVLGEAKTSEKLLGEKIPTEISERWGKILVEGLGKEQKENLISKTLVPENFQLAKAPELNEEVESILNESVKNRDKRLEKMQNQLGFSIARLANLISELINNDVCKIDIIKKISETNQILLDLHYEQTMNRRRLLIPILDKSFINIIRGVKREQFLFGDNLGEKIKTTKSIEKSSRQIKKQIFPQTSTVRKAFTTLSSGNLRAPPRQASGPGTARAPHSHTRYYRPLPPLPPPPPPPAGRRPPPPGPRRAAPPPPRPQDRRNRRY